MGTLANFEGSPTKENWSQFWKANVGSQFTRISWSKRRIIRILERYFRAGDEVMDAGCGSGFFSGYFVRQGCKVTSLDYSEKALEIAKAITEGRSKLIQEDLLQSNLSSRLENRYSLVFTDGLFEHFSAFDQRRIMSNLVSVLTSGGYVVTFVPSRWSPWQIIRPFYMPGIKEKPFLMRDLRKLHEEMGLDIVESGGLNTVPLRFSPDRIFGVPFGMLLYVVARKK